MRGRFLLHPHHEILDFSLGGVREFVRPDDSWRRDRQGKRCWINQTVFKETNPKKQLEQPSGTTFAAGDSDTDIFFLRDAKVRLVMNQNKPELMCHSYNQAVGGNWIINPAPIEPRPKKAESYHCGPYNLPDVEDSVHP